MDIKELRIRRLDPKNLVIERLVKPTKKERDVEAWSIVGYYGKIEDMVPALLNLVIDDIPQAGDLARQVGLLAQNIELAQDSITQYLKRYHGATNEQSGQARR